MKTFSIYLLSLLAPLVSGHCIFQRISVDGADQGLLQGLRAPNNNNPVENVRSNDIICGTSGSTSQRVITVPGGARVGAQYQHVIGGPQGSNDADNPIAASHKGPIIVYLAKVSNAASSGHTGLSWFKVAQEGLNNGRWAVDTSIAANGWWYFTMPSCIAPGQYLMKVELIALHSAYSSGAAQFYSSCAQIQVTGSGSFTPSSTVSFPGAYSASDPGIQLNIYSGSTPNNGGRPYTIPGPSVMTCGSGGNPQPTTARTSQGVQPTTAPAPGGSAPIYGQCGGQGWTGPTTCASGSCKASNQFYSQCLP